MKKISALFVAISSITIFAQSTVVSSAGIAYKSYTTEKMSGNVDAAVKELVDAKKFIDQAYVHAETKDDPKCLMYYGQIYIEIPMMAQATANPTLLEVDPEKAVSDGLAALKRSKELDIKKRYHEDIDGYLNMYYALLRNMGSAAYGEEKYAEAMGGLLGAAMFSDAMGAPDSAAYFYGSIAAFKVDSMRIAAEGFAKCAEMKYQTGSSVYYWSQALAKQGKKDEQEKMLLAQSQANPSAKDILIELINFYIDQDKKEEAEKALKAAIALDPNNPALIYTSGTIYENLDRFEDAEAAYTKTLSIDAENVDAAFALGGLYFNKGADLNNEANKLPFGDPGYDKMVADSKLYFDKSIPFLEKAYANTTDDITIMTSLRDAYGKAGQKEKFLEMKTKIETLKGGQ